MNTGLKTGYNGPVLGAIFDSVFYLPLYNGLVFLIDYVPSHDVGIALIILTIIVKLLLFPLSKKASLSQYRLRSLEGEVAAIREKYASDKALQAKKTMELYKSRNVNPFTGILTLIVQIPILIALYLIFLKAGLPAINADYLYSLVEFPTTVNTTFLGLIDLTSKSMVLAFLAGFSQFIQARVALPPLPHREPSSGNERSFKDDLAKSMNLQFRYIMPVVVAVISYTLPSAIALYWSVGNIFAIGQELVIKRAVKKHNIKI